MSNVKRISAGFQGVSQAAYVKRCTNIDCNRSFGDVYPTREQAVMSWDVNTRCPDCGTGLFA
jgi:hypothetical protein